MQRCRVKCAPDKKVHPLWLRLTHWINAVAMTLMILSGWRIYNASPLFPFDFPNSYTLGGWLGGALQWHFAAMWLFAGNGVLYLTLNLLSGRFRQRFLPLSMTQLVKDGLSALKGHLSHHDLRQYNMVQKFAYFLVVIDGMLLAFSGLVLWKSVQFPLLREVLGGYDTARFIHFFAMAFLCAFVVIHLIMVALVPKTLLLMTRGR
ncbi:cytochrome b/b6 domain-containing protein [Pantoea sp. JGM49]|uniref:cytochrome b/b6 domain-containing protein n=1 Tax=Pantoea sp. JGM49 TaxID=2799791 RepID=UPI001BA47986|nr:cytochrome b/b6 domain-containing protein [Pantoea sp. JGM49]MBS0879359.1 cytochrome b/b6 domain-containing protein [Pantoea sp. JGM49]